MPGRCLGNRDGKALLWTDFCLQLGATELAHPNPVHLKAALGRGLTGIGHQPGAEAHGRHVGRPQHLAGMVVDLELGRAGFAAVYVVGVPVGIELHMGGHIPGGRKRRRGLDRVILHVRVVHHADDRVPVAGFVSKLPGRVGLCRPSIQTGVQMPGIRFQQAVGGDVRRTPHLHKAGSGPRLGRDGDDAAVHNGRAAAAVGTERPLGRIQCIAVKGVIKVKDLVRIVKRFRHKGRLRS